jgi:hypothetical protein
MFDLNPAGRAGNKLLAVAVSVGFVQADSTRKLLSTTRKARITSNREKEFARRLRPSTLLGVFAYVQKNTFYFMVHMFRGVLCFVGFAVHEDLSADFYQ